MIKNKKEILNNLEKMYMFLRDNGYSIYLNEIKSLLFFIKSDNKKGVLKLLKSRILFGGAGSFSDFAFQDSDLNNKKKNLLKDLKELKKNIKEPFWKFW